MLEIPRFESHPTMVPLFQFSLEIHGDDFGSPHFQERIAAPSYLSGLSLDQAIHLLHGEEKDERELSDAVAAIFLTAIVNGLEAELGLEILLDNIATRPGSSHVTAQIRTTGRIKKKRKTAKDYGQIILAILNILQGGAKYLPQDIQDQLTHAAQEVLQDTVNELDRFLHTKTTPRAENPPSRET